MVALMRVSSGDVGLSTLSRSRVGDCTRTGEERRGERASINWGRLATRGMDNRPPGALRAPSTTSLLITFANALHALTQVPTPLALSVCPVQSAFSSTSKSVWLVFAWLAWMAATARLPFLKA
jgi:hypothetical protein